MELYRMTQPSIDRLPVVLSRIGVSRSTLYKLIEQGQFKAPLKLGPRSVGWLSTDSDDFIAARVQASRQQVS
jgi:prophage regulatory protein